MCVATQACGIWCSFRFTSVDPHIQFTLASFILHVFQHRFVRVLTFDGQSIGACVFRYVTISLFMVVGSLCDCMMMSKAERLPFLRFLLAKS